MRTFGLFFVAFLAILVPTVQAQDCAVCQTVILLIENWLENNATEQQIIQYLNTICAAFPAYQQTCDQIADQGVTQIIAWIEQNETPDQVCQQLGLCTSNNKLYRMPRMPKKVNDDVECDTCVEVIGLIENWLANSDDQEQVIIAVQVVCTYMPEWQNTCNAIIAAGVPEVIQWIITYENATVVCIQLGSCDAAKPKVIAPPKPPVAIAASPSDNCDGCTMIVGYIEVWVAQNATEAQIVQYLQTLCSAIPIYQQVCDTIVSTEVPAIIAYLEANQSPETICTELGLCTSKRTVVVN